MWLLWETEARREPHHFHRRRAHHLLFRPGLGRRGLGPASHPCPCLLRLQGASPSQGAAAHRLTSPPVLSLLWASPVCTTSSCQVVTHYGVLAYIYIYIGQKQILSQTFSTWYEQNFLTMNAQRRAPVLCSSSFIGSNTCFSLQEDLWMYIEKFQSMSLGGLLWQWVYGFKLMKSSWFHL